jgi:hypothetical protein
MNMNLAVKTSDKYSNYKDLVANLHTIYAQNKQNAEQTISDVSLQLQQCGRSGAYHILTEILEDRALLEQIAARSYLHGNGFYKIILDENDVFRLRLHIWLPTSTAEENIHDHRWHFASTILSGTVESEIWEDASSGAGEWLDEYLYIGKTKTEDAHVKYMGKSRVSLKEKVVHKAGDAYYMMSNVMHRIVYSGKNEISTLMCHAKDARSWARTVTRKQDLPDVDHAYLSVSELQQILQIYVKGLARPL